MSEVTRLDRSNFSAAQGLRAAVFVVAPVVVGFATGHPEFVYATLGALFVTNTEGPNGSSLPIPSLLVSCFTESIAFGLGTLVGLTGLWAIPILGSGVFLTLLAGGDRELAPVGRFTAIFFAVGVGLPGGSTGVALERLWLSLLGGILALLGAWLHRSLTRRATSGGAGTQAIPARSQFPWPAAPSLQSEAFRHSVAVGAASALGFTVGLALGLPRDFWIVVTIIVALRPRIGVTVSSTEMMVIGTIAGAAIAGAITVATSNVYLLEGLLLVFGAITFATRGVNLGLSQVFLTPFVIVLLNLLYPGQWQLAEYRLLDVTIGGAIAILTVYLVRVGVLAKRLRL